MGREKSGGYNRFDSATFPEVSWPEPSEAVLRTTTTTTTVVIPRSLKHNNKISNRSILYY